MDFFTKSKILSQKSLATVPVDAQNTNEKDSFLSVLFIVFCRLCALADKNEKRYCCLSVWLLKEFSLIV